MLKEVLVMSYERYLLSLTSTVTVTVNRTLIYLRMQKYKYFANSLNSALKLK